MLGLSLVVEWIIGNVFRVRCAGPNHHREGQRVMQATRLFDPCLERCPAQAMLMAVIRINSLRPVDKKAKVQVVRQLT